jgi:hypothetical protein
VPPSTPSRYLAEIMYEAVEHKYMDSPSLKFRHPAAHETKRFVRAFEFRHPPDDEFESGGCPNTRDPLQRGDRVPVLLLPGINNTRSGCPQHVVDRVYDAFPGRKVATILLVATVALAVLLTMTVRNSFVHLEDPRQGWAVLLVLLVASDAVGLLLSLDRFLKAKRRRFDSALPMVSAADQREAIDHRRQEEDGPGLRGRGDPFKIPLHEFAGHARASERHRFD